MSVTEHGVKTLVFEVVESRNSVNGSEYAVEAINYSGDGEVYVALFSGPKAKKRAEEYAQWKNTGGGAKMAA